MSVRHLILEYWTPLAAWLFLMSVFSSDMMSSGETSRFIVPLLTFFFPDLSPTQLDLGHGIIRKFGHVAEYFILALLAYRSLKYEHPDPVDARLRTISFVILVALLDEMNQGLTVSRGPSLIDVGYDGLGGVWALWLITTYEGRRLRPHPVL